MIKLHRPLGHKEAAHRLTLGPHRLYFSHEHLVGYDGPGGEARASDIGERNHIREMGLTDFPVRTGAKLESEVEGTVIK